MIIQNAKLNISDFMKSFICILFGADDEQGFDSSKIKFKNYKFKIKENSGYSYYNGSNDNNYSYVSKSDYQPFIYSVSEDSDFKHPALIPNINNNINYDISAYLVRTDPTIEPSESMLNIFNEQTIEGFEWSTAFNPSNIITSIKNNTSNSAKVSEIYIVRDTPSIFSSEKFRMASGLITFDEITLPANSTSNLTIDSVEFT